MLASPPPLLAIIIMAPPTTTTIHIALDIYKSIIYIQYLQHTTFVMIMIKAYKPSAALPSCIATFTFVINMTPGKLSTADTCIFLFSHSWTILYTHDMTSTISIITIHS